MLTPIMDFGTRQNKAIYRMGLDISRFRTSLPGIEIGFWLRWRSAILAPSNPSPTVDSTEFDLSLGHRTPIVLFDQTTG